MTEQRRGRNVSLVGAALQTVFTIVMLIVWLSTGSLAAMACLALLAGGIPLWLVTALMFYSRQMAAQEQREMEELAARDRDRAGLFEGEDADQVRPAAARQRMIERWIVPIVTLLWAAYHVALGVVVYRYGETLVAEAGDHVLTLAAEWTLGALLLAFVAFLFSRYCVGMGNVAHWRLLRATGSYLFVNVLAIAAVAIALLAGYKDYTFIDKVVAYAVPLVQWIIALEVVANLVLGYYSPRIPGQEPRPAFDSRLLNLVAEPEKVGHTVAEALNYQFGFEVSKTWFYELLSRSMVPLLLLGAVVMFAMSSLVIVHEGESAVVLHWGRIDPNSPPLGSGLHWKWPWPIDTVRRFETSKVHEVFIGVGQEREPTVVGDQEIYLWQQEHGQFEERNFLIALPSRTAGRDTQQEKEYPAVNVIKLVALIHYRIDDVYEYGFDYSDAAGVLEAIAYQQMTQYMASATLTQEVGDADRPQAIMTHGRKEAARKLFDLIQSEADRRGLGVKLTYVGFSAVHPPKESAESFEKVLEARLKQAGTRYRARSDADQTLGGAAGNPTTALRLALAIQWLSELEQLRDLARDRQELLDQLDRYIPAAREGVRFYENEVERERRQGKVERQMRTSNEVVLEAHREHLKTLKTLREQIDQGQSVDLEERAEKARAETMALLASATGEASEMINEAIAYRWSRELVERSRAQAFESEYQAYQASPHMYMLDRYLDVLDEVLPRIKKYVIGFDRENMEVRLDLQEKGGMMEQIDFRELGQGG